MKKLLFLFALISATFLNAQIQPLDQWRTKGNSFTTNTNWLGTNNNFSLRVRTNGIERFVIDTTAFAKFYFNGYNVNFGTGGTVLYSNSGWSTTGNSGLSYATNFLGTSDNKSILFKTNNVLTGKLDSLGNLSIFGKSAGNTNLSINSPTTQIGTLNYIENGTTNWAQYNNPGVTDKPMVWFDGTSGTNSMLLAVGSLTTVNTPRATSNFVGSNLGTAAANYPSMRLTGTGSKESTWFVTNSNHALLPSISGIYSNATNGFCITDGTTQFFHVGNTGTNKNYLLNDLALGTASYVANAGLEVRKTVEQFRASYDASNYFNITVNSTGSAVMGLTGSTGTLSTPNKFTVGASNNASMTVSGQSFFNANAIFGSTSEFQGTMTASCSINCNLTGANIKVFPVTTEGFIVGRRGASAGTKCIGINGDANSNGVIDVTNADLIFTKSASTETWRINTFGNLNNYGSTSSGQMLGVVGTASITGLVTSGGGIKIATAQTLNFASGTNTRAGNATLVGGTITVANTSVGANTLVILTRKTSGGTIGTAITYTISNGTSFTITSDNILDTSTFSYMLIENN